MPTKDARPGAGGAASLNRFFDALPRSRVFRGSCERPAFRSLGVAGYHVALVATLAAGLFAGRSLLVLAVLAAVCAVSFFAWAYLRRAITGREELVLLEHVWVAELASTGALALMREPILPYLDALAVGLAVFLAFGRVGCLLAGCCHGHPASVGVRYGEELARDGFPAHLVGVRLFPVQAIEALALGGIAIAALPLAAGATPGRALAWFLFAYAVLRFGLEGLRGDDRPHALGLSQARWMALVELGAALAIADRGAAFTPIRAAEGLFLAAVLAASLVLARRRDPRRLFLAAAHLAELRAATRAAVERATAGPVPEIGRTGAWVSIGVSLLDEGRWAHISLALPLDHAELRLLCEVAASALPELDPATGHTAPARLLHVRVPLPLAETAPPPDPSLAESLYGATLRRSQAPAIVEHEPPEQAPRSLPAAPQPDAPSPAAPSPAAPGPRADVRPSPWDRQIPAAIEEELRRVWSLAPPSSSRRADG